MGDAAVKRMKRRRSFLKMGCLRKRRARRSVRALMIRRCFVSIVMSLSPTSDVELTLVCFVARSANKF